MEEINLNAAFWRNTDDFYDSLLPALGAPSWHGRNLDALDDSLSADNINEVKLPFHVRIRETSSLPADLISYLKRLDELVKDLRTDSGLEISLTLE